MLRHNNLLFVLLCSCFFVIGESNIDRVTYHSNSQHDHRANVTFDFFRGTLGHGLTISFTSFSNYQNYRNVFQNTVCNLVITKTGFIHVLLREKEI